MDHSIYEKNHPQRKEKTNNFCLGRITKVYADERMCEVKTFMGPGNLNDNHIPKAQWLSTDGHPDGDESGFIPRVNSYCLVFFVQGAPFVWGFFSPLNDKGNTVQEGKEKEDLFEGDRVFKTAAGNKIILRAHGEIQLESTKSCRTIYLPTRHIINTLCRNYEFATDGGSIDWVEIENGDTTYKQELRDTVDRDNVAIIEYGTPTDGADFFFRKEIGPGSKANGPGFTDTPVWSMSTKSTGETDLFIRAASAPSGFKLNILPSGNTKLNIADSLNIEIKPTGEVTLNINKKHNLNIKPDGTTDLNINDKVKLKMTASGETTLDSSGAKFKYANSKIGMGSGSIELLAKIVEELEKLSTFCDMAKQHQHTGNLGYLTTPPVDPSPWDQLKTATNKVKGDINTIKGGV